jgi:RNA polymerase sigma-70 factor (ECF subfamily)
LNPDPKRDEPALAPADDPFSTYVLPEIDYLLRSARGLTRNSADAEDLAQETMLRAYRAIDRFDGRHPRAWLLTIMRNTHINAHRRRRPELLHDPEVADRLDLIPKAAGTDHFVDLTFDAEVERVLADLPDTFRAVVDLVDIGGLSYAEAAAALGVPTGTVMSRLHRARGRIRDHLDRAGVAPRRRK